MMPDTQGNTIQRPVEAEALASALSPLSARAVKRRLERILSDDREMLISLECQLEQIRGGSQLLNDDRVVRALDDRDHQLHH